MYAVAAGVPTFTGAAAVAAAVAAAAAAAVAAAAGARLTSSVSVSIASVLASSCGLVLDCSIFTSKMMQNVLNQFE
jgi:hypothetical protein